MDVSECAQNPWPPLLFVLLALKSSGHTATTKVRFVTNNLAQQHDTQNTNRQRTCGKRAVCCKDLRTTYNLPTTHHHWCRITLGAAAVRGPNTLLFGQLRGFVLMLRCTRDDTAQTQVAGLKNFLRAGCGEYKKKHANQSDGARKDMTGWFKKEPVSGRNTILCERQTKNTNPKVYNSQWHIRTIDMYTAQQEFWRPVQTLSVKSCYCDGVDRFGRNEAF